jgi:hypothetical protein
VDYDLDCALAMTCTRTRGLTLLLLLGLFICTITASKATAETFTLPAGQTTVRTVDLNADDEVSGRISVVSSDESNQITFIVYGSEGTIVLPATTVFSSNFNFKAAKAGTYSFVFDNSLSTGDKTVSFNYDVQHYWFGMPQEFVLMLIVVFLGVLGLVVYAMVSKKHFQ